MLTFKYKARDKTGRLISGYIEAGSADAASEKLKASGFTPVTIKETILIPAFFKKILPQPKVHPRKISTFTRQLATLQKAGVSLINCLEATQEQADDKVLKAAIKKMVEEVRAGDSFSSALSSHKNIFTELYISMIRVAETGGALPEVLERLANLLEYEEDTKTRIKTATRYPMIVVLALIIAFIVLITLVIPRFMSIYERFEMQLPLPTRMLIRINFAVTHYWWAILIVIAAIIFSFKKYINTKKGRLQWDGVKLKMPVFGKLVIMLTMSRFTRILAILTKSGVSILETLDLVAKGVGNTVISRAIDGIKTGVTRGQGLAGPMKLSGFFPPMVIQMVAVGEESGKLSNLLMHVSDYYDAQSEYIIKNLSTLLEPILIVFLGLGVLFIALGVFLPMWNLVYLFKR